MPSSKKKGCKRSRSAAFYYEKWQSGFMPQRQVALDTRHCSGAWFCQGSSRSWSVCVKVYCMPQDISILAPYWIHWLTSDCFNVCILALDNSVERLPHYVKSEVFRQLKHLFCKLEIDGESMKMVKIWFNLFFRVLWIQIIKLKGKISDSIEQDLQAKNLLH